MRLIVLAVALVAAAAANAQEQAADKDTPQPNSTISVTTPTLTYRSAVFLREQISAGATYWVLKTDSGVTTVPRSAIVKFEVVMTGNPKRSEAPNLAALEPGSLELRVHGSNTIGAALAPEIAKAFAARNGLAAVTKKIVAPDELDLEYRSPENSRRYLFHFQAHGTATGFQSLLAGAADIGMASRRINAKEDEALRLAGLGDLQATGAENVIALDGVAVIVNPANPVNALTLAQIAGIFSGQVRSWEEVGGKPGPILVYSRDNKSGTFDTFRTLVLETGSAKELSAAAKRFESSEELSDAVASDPGGIGFIGFAYIRNAKPLTLQTQCGLRFPPEPFLVRTEEYPLSRRLYFYAPEQNRKGQAETFLAFALSAEAQPAIASAGFISLDVQQSADGYVKERAQAWKSSSGGASAKPKPPQDFALQVAGAARLSITFRFKKNSTELDNRSRLDVGRLVAYIRAHPASAGELRLLGFSDAKGDLQTNIDLSRQRARQVAEALRGQGVAVRQEQIQGFGPIAPVACSDAPNSLEKNRRVEVWLRR